METHFKEAVHRIPVLRKLKWIAISHGPEGIREVGHRRYVGGDWEEIGRLQFDFLIRQGLSPHHHLLDIACGSLRGGVHFIPYLDVGHYCGIEKEEDLIRAGVNEELGEGLYERKKPQLVVSPSFEFEKFEARPNFALAQSLFTHLPAPLVHDCFRKLRKVISEDGVFFATFLETEKTIANPTEPDDHACFLFSRGEIEAFGTDNGWIAEYIGGWDHPKGQRMVRFLPARSARA